MHTFYLISNTYEFVPNHVLMLQTFSYFFVYDVYDEI